jgi:hypothetical protein
MPNVKNLDFAFGFADVIVDEEWAVYQLADMGSLSNQSAHARKASQQLDVLHQGTAKMRGSLRVIFGNVSDDFCEIV